MVKQEQRYEIGMVGLGVMGRNLLLNMADHGYSVAGYDVDASKVQALREEAEARDIQGATGLEQMVGMLRTPRAVIMLVPAGPPVDAVVRDLLPHLQPGDMIIDGGNSHFTDTDLRAKTLAEKGILYLGVGVSGGEHGARHGPSIMPGGPKEAYERVQPLFEAIAAHVDGDPCVTYLGPGSAGHYVKMVHNGIEYGLMQLIAETYDVMKRRLGLSDARMHVVYKRWNESELSSYLLEITADILRHVDEKTGKCLIDVILDKAKQLGTGQWTSQDAMELGVPIPTIDVAVAMRSLSAMEEERVAAGKVLLGPVQVFHKPRDPFLEQLRAALYAGMIVTYAQGVALLRHASQARGYGVKLEDVARIWRGGCIIRSALLEHIRSAYRANPDLPNLLVDPYLARELMARQEALRAVVCTAAELGLPAAGLGISLGYYDAYRSAWLPANLTQAQRDYFGAHTYERIDAKGVFHTRWSAD
ncbi:MAG: NADP-dependent phosphogluconate dehydrogenase [Bacteroidetes bacterium]|nr:NADP-dependent phosphogluconate dehydrogenase [Bacteroidota bacterium]MCL5026488.1 NADP-dependent phosphogluconate dehydrogenase [Chloroflexota bacterium]